MTDVQKTPKKIILNRSAAKALFGAENPIGHVLEKTRKLLES